MDAVSIVALVVILIILLVVAYFVKAKFLSSVKRDTVLLAGLSGAGKTHLFSQLCHDHVPVDTVPSLKHNSGFASALGDKADEFTIVDTPGADRLRTTYLAQYGLRTKALVFMIDSKEFGDQLKDVAEYLFNLLSSPLLAGVPILVLCNKQDYKFRAKKMGAIQFQLEKEVNLTRKTRAARLASISDKDGGEVFIGKQGEDFKFEHLDNKVEWLEFTAKPPSGKAEFGALEAWLSTATK